MWPNRRQDETGFETLVLGLSILGVSAIVMLGVVISETWEALAVAIAFSLLGLLLLWQGLWNAFSQWEWRVGPDLLEVHRTLWGLCQVRRYLGTALEVSYWSYTLRGRAAHHDEGWGLFVREGDRKRLLLSGASQVAEHKSSLCAIGEFLSQETGWPLSIGRRRRE